MADRSGTSDPYLVFGLVDANGKWIGKQTKTDVAKETLAPRFWESEDMPAPDFAHALKVECWDHNAIVRKISAVTPRASSDLAVS